MIKKWKEIPEQVKRILFIFIIFIVVFLFVRSLLIPPDFGKIGHYRFSAINEIVSQKAKYAGQTVCNECHDDIFDQKQHSNHKNLSCEVCHGPSLVHTEDPGEFSPNLPRKREDCTICHEYISSRPTGFPQIVSESHNPIKACISCHNPHFPITPEVPKECGACHANIARTKSISHHAYVPCIKCHNVPDQHKINPREFIPDKPMQREFCGQCHSIDAVVEMEIPRIDMATHEVKYVCWQCHYPHLPEAR